MMFIRKKRIGNVVITRRYTHIHIDGEKITIHYGSSKVVFRGENAEIAKKFLRV
jgi:hypothetical protein